MSKRASVKSRFSRGTPKTKLHLAGFTALVCAAFNVAKAQQVIIAPRPVPIEPAPVEQSSDTNEVSTANSGGPSMAGSGIQYRNPFQYGPFNLHPRIGYGFTYGSGLQSRRGQSTDSAINTISPSIGIDVGKHWTVSYTAAAAFYSDKAFKDNVDHNISVRGQTTYEDWAFNLSQGIALTSDPLTETAQQTDEQSYSTELGASYQINAELSAEISAGQNIHSSQGVANSVGSSTDWTLSGNLNYQLGPHLSTGFGTGFGYNKVGVGPDTTYEDLNLRMSYQLVRKLSLSVNGGAQFRQFLGSGQSTLISPTFGASANYHAFDYTTISLSATRGVNDSFFSNQVTESTSVSLSLSQRLLAHFYLTVNGGYDLSTYKDSAPGGTVGIHGREDTRTFFGVTLSTSFLKHGSASVSYNRSDNSSNSAGFGYNSDQIGVSLSFGY